MDAYIYIYIYMYIYIYTYVFVNVCMFSDENICLNLECIRDDLKLGIMNSLFVSMIKL